MVITYRNNRIVPAVIITICMISIYCLLQTGPAAYGRIIPSFSSTHDQSKNPLGQTHNAKPNTETSGDKSLNKPSQSLVMAEKPSIVAEQPKQTLASEKTVADGTSGGALTNDDVLLIMKTGGTTTWKRLLIHLTTSLASERISRDNIVIYSDIAEKVGGFSTIDVFANMTDEAKAKPDFDVYREQPEFMANNYYVENSGVDGDDWGPPGGWIIDKYKFVPLMQHAGANWPKAKWYIYMEDDTYLFLPNIISYLSKFDWRKPHYLGHYAAKSNVVFAHGGAGFVVSRGAWEKSFGTNPSMTEKYYEYTAGHCCGDQVLAHALKDSGIGFGENGGDGKFTWGFNPIVHWVFSFTRNNWCQPLLSWHKVHSRDVSDYYGMEKEWDFSKGPLLHRDFFNKKILPAIQKPIECWDNMASLYEVTSGNKENPPAPKGKYDSALWKNGWESERACEAACKGWEECLQWTYVEDLCKMDTKVVMGQGFAPSMSQRKTSLKHTSGWMTDRLDDWIC